MIQTVIDALDAAIALNLPTVNRHGVAELMQVEGGMMPVVYADNGSFVPIANDNSGTFSYWRYNGKESDKGVDLAGSACGGYEVTMPLRFVAMVDRAICPNVQNAARAAAWGAMDTDSSIRSAINAVSVNFPSSAVDTDSRRVYQQEFGKGLENADKAWVAIDITVQVTGLAECFDPCERTGSFLCRLIQAKTWAQIQKCLTDAQEAAAIDALCGIDICEQIGQLDGQAVVACIASGEVPIALCTIMARPEATPDIGVECIGNAGLTSEYQALLCTPQPAESCYWRSITLGT